MSSAHQNVVNAITVNFELPTVLTIINIVYSKQLKTIQTKRPHTIKSHTLYVIYDVISMQTIICWYELHIERKNMKNCKTILSQLSLKSNSKQMAPHTHAQGRANPLNSVQKNHLQARSQLHQRPSISISTQLNKTNSHKNLMVDKLQIENHQP